MPLATPRALARSQYVGLLQSRSLRNASPNPISLLLNREITSSSQATMPLTDRALSPDPSACPSHSSMACSAPRFARSPARC
ncbi:hypothetical protein BDA96_09G031900 [Sorghum bicolor]|uniref:Uncharacterized protein n=1 Tax=Sorghum bicolor TaxID=4558 RepID=A0A921Q9H6_SORBI|nr:hypothetical protein BDA96_09G031900 [Sorghum bicolor]